MRCWVVWGGRPPASQHHLRLPLLMHSADSGSGEHGDERREIFSSESRRSFHTPAPAEQQTSPAQKGKPRRPEANADETAKASDETTPVKSEADLEPREPKPEADKSTGAEPRSDEPPASLDVSIDEGPL